MKKVVVGMSGGVDSSVAALLLKEQGYEVIGVTMQLWQDEVHAVDAKRVAETLGIPHYVVDFKEVFRRQVVDYFGEEYLQGRTPNPCIACNRYVKWEALLEYGKEWGADYIATGHYAGIDRLPSGRYAVRSSVTAAKDQTYVLYNLTQEQLSRTLMPVGAFAKEEIREMASKAGLPVAHKPDSQDICFVPDGDYAAFLERWGGNRVPGPGNFVSADGRVLGQHQGITHYTIGQRKGLGIALGHPVFVCGICPERNEVVLGENQELFTTEVRCHKVNYMAMEELREPRRALVKIRYSHHGTMCVLEPQHDGNILCRFEEPVRAATPGQAAVFYEGEYVLGGGTIL